MKKVLLLFIALLLLAPAKTAPLIAAQASGNLIALNPVFKPASFSFTATGTKNINVNGIGPVVITVTGTNTGFTFNFKGANDGVSFVALPVVSGLIGGAAPGTAATQPVTAASPPQVFSTNVAALTSIQVGATCSSCTGTLTFQISGQGR